MNVTIQKSKNGENTVLIDGHFLHSSYEPEKEARRFIENLNFPYTPLSVIITEPGLSYIVPFFRKTFPGIKLGVIRYLNNFQAYDKNFDFVLNYYEHPDFENYLVNSLSEEELLSAFFISWPASTRIFSDYEKLVWVSIKKAMDRAKTILITRQYFEKKWFLNSCNFLRYHHSLVSFTGIIASDVLIICSGPSLKPYLDFIRENQQHFFIICLSSAISACLKNSIKIDLCMTTDGGYWAGEHLKKLRDNNIPLAMPSEAYCSRKSMKNLKILPLIYPDGISAELCRQVNINFKPACRNGTVSGTALLFAAAYFSKNIFFTGLDMACSSGFQHAQPNELENNSSYSDNRLKTKEQRISQSGLNPGSLDIYKNWFCTNQLKLQERKVYRLIENKYKKNTLNWIKDIQLDDFKKLINPEVCKKNIFIDQKTDKNEIMKVKNLLRFSENEKWKKQLFPLDYVSLSHNSSNTEIQNKIETGWKALIQKAADIFDENI